MTQPDNATPPRGGVEPLPKPPAAEPIPPAGRQPAAIPGANLGLEPSNAGTGQPATAPAEAEDDVVATLAERVRQAASTEQIAEAVPQLTDALLRRHIAAVEAGLPGAVPRGLDSLSVAFNLRATTAQLQDDSAGVQRAVEDYQREVQKIAKRVDAVAAAGVPGGESENVERVAVVQKKLDALVARQRGDRAAELTAWREAAQAAEGLWDACLQANEAGKGSPAAILEASTIRFDAEMALAEVETGNPAAAGTARLNLLRQREEELRTMRGRLEAAYRAGSREVSSRMLDVVGCLTDLASAALAKEQGNAAGEVAALRAALEQVTPLAERARIEYGVGGVSVREAIEASRLLSHVTLLLGLATQTGPGDAARVRLAAYQEHRDRLEALLDRALTQYKAGGDSSDVLYAAGRYAWIRLQIAGLMRRPTAQAAPANVATARRPQPQAELRPQPQPRPQPTQSPAPAVRPSASLPVIVCPPPCCCVPCCP